MFWEHGPSGRGSRDVAQRVPKKRRGVDFQFDSPSDSVEGMSEQESGLVKRSEEVADHGERRVRRIFEKNGGSFSSVDTTLDLGDFQNGRQRKIDFDEFSVLSQIRDNISGRTVSHGSAGSVVSFDVETRAKVYAGRIAHLGTRILCSQRNTAVTRPSEASALGLRSALSFFRPKGGRKIKGSARFGFGSCKFRLRRGKPEWR